MKFTFCIITNERNPDRLKTVINSIDNECSWKNSQIIICGPNARRYGMIFEQGQLSLLEGSQPYQWDEHFFRYIEFDESQKNNWITKKKNLIVNDPHIMYENLVFLHDYVSLSPGWYKGFLEFGDDWDVCMTRINNLDGTRFRDWITWDDPDFGGSGKIVEKWCPNGLLCKGGPTLVPYDYNKTNLMYVSGTYWVAKKQFMLDNPLDESLVWGEGEDVEWSLRVRDKWNYKMNPFSSVSLLKQK